MLLAILLLGAAGLGTELLLLAHDEDVTQRIPLGLLLATCGVSVAVMVKPSPLTVRVFQAVMLLMIASAALGMYFHLSANMEFQLEMDPALTGMALFRKSLVAKAPPALAPGAMAQLGLIGLAYTFRHPALFRGTE